MSTYLVFSPHLDDAVLSCGAQIAMWTQLGHHVVVATVFSTASESHTSQYALRRADDERAVRALGATPVYLDFIDAPFRNPQYRNFSTLLLHETLPDDSRDMMLALRVRIQSLARELEAIALYFPLAVGGHVDHLAVFVASRACWSGSTPVHYYQDLPYALVPGWVGMRWQQHGACTEHVLQANFAFTRLQDLPLAFLESYMEDAADLQASETLHAAQVSKLSPASATACSWKLGTYTFTQQQATMPPAYLQRKINAIRCYTSEWPVLFGSSDHAIEKTLHTNVHEYTEIYWTLNH